MASLTPEQRRLFQDKNFVAVATVGKDGGPRNAIVWVDIEGDTLIINGARSRAWLKNLKRNPGGAVAVFDPTNPYRRVTVIGTAVEITEEGGRRTSTSCR
ncbi:MAG: pyridoxamine 5'-phosphate oxidase family protein [Dehalococcoidia bacterium]